MNSFFLCHFIFNYFESLISVILKFSPPKIVIQFFFIQNLTTSDDQKLFPKLQTVTRNIISSAFLLSDGHKYCLLFTKGRI